MFLDNECHLYAGYVVAMTLNRDQFLLYVLPDSWRHIQVVSTNSQIHFSLLG
jgi:hypothetical protein